MVFWSGSYFYCHYSIVIQPGLGGGVFITPVGSDVITVTWYDQHHVTTETPKSSATPLRLYTCELLEPGPSVCLPNSSPQHAGRQPEIGGQLFPAV